MRTTDNTAQDDGATVSIAPFSDDSFARYEFGVRLDKECRDVVEAEITKARSLNRALIACIRDIVAQMQAFVLAMSGQAGAELRTQIEACNALFDQATASNDREAMRTQASQRLLLWREQAKLLAQVRKEHGDELKTRFYSRIGRNAGTDTYALRVSAVAAGLGWATADAILENSLKAYHRAIALGRAPRLPGDWRLQETLTLRFPRTAGGMPVPRILAGQERKLVLVPGGAAGKRSYGELRFRIGPATENCEAVGTWQYHRALPTDGHVLQAQLVRRELGPDTRWSVQLLVKRSPGAQGQKAARRPLAAVHFGWAADTGGRRVAAVAHSENPDEADLVQLPPSVERDLERASLLQGRRDTSRGDFVNKLRAQAPDTIPPSVQEEISQVLKLQAHQVGLRRLRRICEQWPATFEGTRRPKWVRAWQRADRLRWQAGVHISRRARMRRRDFYRDVAAFLAREYEAIVLEPLQLKEVATKVDWRSGGRGTFDVTARAGAKVAALFELESSLRWACAKAGTVVLDLRGKTTSICAKCGAPIASDTEEKEEKPSQTLDCPQCGAIVDRKCNAAALAWQIVAKDREEWMTRYYLQTADEMARRSAESLEKLARIQAGRKARRSAGQTEATPPDGE